MTGDNELFFPQASNAIQNNKWKSAERYGRVAFYLTIANWIYVLSFAIFLICLFYYNFSY